MTSLMMMESAKAMTMSECRQSGPADRDDGVGDDSDNCPQVRNPGQADGDGDGLGDV